MKRALAKFFQGLTDRFDPVEAGRRIEIKRAAEFWYVEAQAARAKAQALTVIVPEVPADWLPDNAAALRTFLDSHHGKILSNRLRTIVALNAVAGARNANATIHAAGRSAGWDEAVRYLHSLSLVSSVKDTPNDKQTPQDEASLLEQLSP